MELTKETIFEIAGEFKFNGKTDSISPYGSGHINDTFLVICKTSESPNRYILRRINGFVFKRPEIVVKNTRLVLEHIAKKWSYAELNKKSNRILSLVESKNGQFHFLDKDGGFWCAMPFCEGTYTVDFVATPEHAYQAAKAFGEFQKLVLDANLEEFKPTIPDFHNTVKRFTRFKTVVEKDSFDRNRSAGKEIAFALENEHLPLKMNKLLEDKTISFRLTHNDTKINNVLFDKETDKAICVIDFDTVMPGTTLYDFGDMVRTSTCPVAEDEKDLSKVFLNIKIFEALARGYLEELKGIITGEEIENLVYGAELIIFEQGIRFLTDYLEGDVYYKTDYPGHNLDRTKNQFALLKSVQHLKTEMENIVKELTNIGEK